MIQEIYHQLGPYLWILILVILLGLILITYGFIRDRTRYYDPAIFYILGAGLSIAGTLVLFMAIILN